MAATIAAGCGGTEGGVTQTTNAAVATDAVTSADGLFTITPPAGSGAITIDDLMPDESGVAVLGSYDLGPDGAHFDEPVQIDFQVSSEDLAGGVVGYVESTDGSVEGLTLELVDTDAGRVVRSSLSHFSRVTYIHGLDPAEGTSIIYLPSPNEVTVGDTLDFSLVGWIDPTTPGSDSKVLMVDSRRPENWLINPPLEGTPPFPVTCTEPGTPVITVDGVFDTTFLVYQDGGTATQVNGTVAFSDERQITCVERAPIREADFRCIEVGTGLETTGCPVPEVSVSVTHPGAFLADFEYPKADLSVIFSLFMNEDEANPILIEYHSDGTTYGYAGLGFSAFPPGGAITGEGVDTDAGSRFTFLPSLHLDSTGTALVFTVESADGVEGGPRTVTDITVFAEVDGKRSTTLLDMADVIANWVH